MEILGLLVFFWVILGALGELVWLLKRSGQVGGLNGWTRAGGAALLLEAFYTDAHMEECVTGQHVPRMSDAESRLY